jgi:hypothetical protein
MAAGLFAAGLIIAALAPPGLVSVPRSLPFVIAMALLAPDFGFAVRRPGRVARLILHGLRGCSPRTARTR